jgi:hypothetical protein
MAIPKNAKEKNGHFKNVCVSSFRVTVFARSNAGIVGSNPTQAMDICVRLFCV